MLIPGVNVFGQAPFDGNLNTTNILMPGVKGAYYRVWLDQLAWQGYTVHCNGRGHEGVLEVKWLFVATTNIQNVIAHFEFCVAWQHKVDNYSKRPSALDSVTLKILYKTMLLLLMTDRAAQTQSALFSTASDVY